MLCVNLSKYDTFSSLTLASNLEQRRRSEYVVDFALENIGKIKMSLPSCLIGAIVTKVIAMHNFRTSLSNPKGGTGQR
jgi:hypothetical protein